MSQISSLIPKVQAYLGNQNSTYYDDAKIYKALSWARNEIVMVYEPDELLQEITLSFVGGLADKLGRKNMCIMYRYINITIITIYYYYLYYY